MPCLALHAAASLLAAKALGLDLKETVVFTLLGVAPDFDFLVGRHKSETHSVFAASAVAAAATLVGAPAMALSYAFHVFLDALTGPTPLIAPIKPAGYYVSFSVVVDPATGAITPLFEHGTGSPVPSKPGEGVSREGTALLAMATLLYILL